MNKNKSHFLLPLFVYLLSGIAAYYAFGKAYGRMDIVGFEETTEWNWLESTVGFQPIYRGENNGHYVIWIFAPLILFFFAMMPGEDKTFKKSILLKSLSLFPIFIVLTYFIILKNISFYKPFSTTNIMEYFLEENKGYYEKHRKR